MTMTRNQLKPAAGPFESLIEMRESPAWQYRAQELLDHARAQGQAWAEREYACLDDPRDALRLQGWNGMTSDIPAEMVYSLEAIEGGPDRTLITDEVVEELRAACNDAAGQHWEYLVEHEAERVSS